MMIPYETAAVSNDSVQRTAEQFYVMDEEEKSKSTSPSHLFSTHVHNFSFNKKVLERESR